jgi:hypothetical protein
MKNKFIILSPQGFVKEFWNKTKHHKTFISAYEELEKEYIELVGKRKYSDYNSFRICRDRKTKETLLQKKR